MSAHKYLQDFPDAYAAFRERYDWGRQRMKEQPDDIRQAHMISRTRRRTSSSPFGKSECLPGTPAGYCDFGEGELGDSGADGAARSRPATAPLPFTSTWPGKTRWSADTSERSEKRASGRPVNF